MNHLEYADEEDFKQTIGHAFQLEQQKKSLVLYTTACLSLNLVVAWLCILCTGVPMLTPYWQILMTAGFFVLGLVHVWVVSRYLVFSGEKGAVTLFSLSLFLGLLSGGGILALITLYNFSIPQLALGAAGAFLLPSTVIVAWRAFDAIQPPSFPGWLLPESKIPKNQLSFFLNSIEISLQLRLNYFDFKETSFPLTVPGSLELGIVFQRFLLEMEEAEIKIELMDQHGAPYSWLFIEEKFPLNKVLNPATTLTDNGVKPGAIVKIERVKLTEAKALIS